MPFQPGLVSVSFRSLSCEEIIALTGNAGLSAIEWGGDVHVPPGAFETACRIGEKTRRAGLHIPTYGSYYRVAVSPPEQLRAVAETARALGAPAVRVWAHQKGSAKAGEEDYRAAVADLRRICLAYPDLTFCTECHNNTLTDDYRVNLRLLADVGLPNCRAFWQPNQWRDHAYNVASACALAPYVSTAHVFAWEGKSRYPLSAHAHRWQDYLDALAHAPGPVNLMLEFMHDDDPESLPAAAKALQELAKRLA